MNNDVTNLIVARLDKIDGKLDRIEKQTTITNGRVGTLEAKVAKFDVINTDVFNRLNIVETTLAINSAIRKTNKNFMDFLLKVSPWVIAFICFLVAIGLKTGVIK